MRGDVVARSKRGTDKPVHEAIEDADQAIKDLFAEVRTFIMALGDDVQEKQLKLYMAYRRIKNFASVVVQKRALLIFLKLDPDTVKLEEDLPPMFQRSVTGAPETSKSPCAIAPVLLKAQPLITSKLRRKLDHGRRASGVGDCDCPWVERD